MTRRVPLAATAVLVAAVAALLALGERTPEGSRRRTAEAYLGEVTTRNAFRRSESAEAYELEYGFVDHQGESHDLACRVLRRDHERLVARFGYSERELDGAAVARQQAFADEELRRRGLAPYFRIEVTRRRSRAGWWRRPACGRPCPPAARTSSAKPSSAYSRR